MTLRSLYVVGTVWSTETAFIADAALFRRVLFCANSSNVVQGSVSYVPRQIQFDQCAAEGTFTNFNASTVGFNDFSHHRQADAVTGH